MARTISLRFRSASTYAAGNEQGQQESDNDGQPHKGACCYADDYRRIGDLNCKPNGDGLFERTIAPDDKSVVAKRDVVRHLMGDG